MTERKDHWQADVDPSFWHRLETHMTLEEERERHDAERFAAGTKRMDMIEEDLKPLKKMFWAVVGSGGAIVLLLASLIYIYQSDKADRKEDKIVIREMQQAIYKQVTAVEKLWMSHQELEKDYRRDFARVESDLARARSAR